MRRERIELEGKGECEGGKRERRVEREGRDDGERDRERKRDNRGHGATRHCTCTCIDTDIYARQLIMSKSFDLSLAFMEGN